MAHRMSLFRSSPPREVRQAFPEPIIAPYPGASFGGDGGAPSMASAMQVSAVWACVRLLADTVSMMPVSAFTLNKAGVRVPIDMPPLLKRPSADADMPDWLYMLVTSLMLRGNAYGRIVERDSNMYPTQIELMDPESVTPRSNNAGGIEYLVNGQVLDAKNVHHQRAYRMAGSPVGMSPISFAARQINTDAAISQFAYAFFRDGAHPSSILSTDQDFAPDQARTIKDRFQAAVTGREPAILTGGLTYQQVQISPEESQFLATQKFGVASIARIFGVPPEMIASESGNSMTYANVEQRSLDFLTYSVQPWLTRIESSLAALLPGNKHVRFDTSVLLRTDLETRYKATAIGIASHQLLPDEARAMGDLPPFTEEEQKMAGLVQMTVTPSGLPKSLPGSPPAGEYPAELHDPAPAASPSGAKK
jgi:HK97 family phage portal protein